MQGTLKRILIIAVNVIAAVIGAYNLALAWQSFVISLPDYNIVALVYAAVSLFLLVLSLVNLVRPVTNPGVFHRVANGVLAYFVISYLGFIFLALIGLGYASFPISFAATFFVVITLLIKKRIKKHNR